MRELEIGEIAITHEDLDWFLEIRKRTFENEIEILFFTKKESGEISAKIKDIILH